MNNSGVLAKHIPVEIDDIASFRCPRLESLNYFGIVARRHKANVLTVVFVGNGQSETAGGPLRLPLCPPPRRGAGEGELFSRRAEKEIALVSSLLPRPIKSAPTSG